MGRWPGHETHRADPVRPVDPDALYDAFVAWTAADGITLYPHQDEAVVDILTGANVIVTTPTGSGKSLIATAAHFAAFAAGGAFYTAPIRLWSARSSSRSATSSGAHNVGMVTGDAAVGADAPIIACTAEILANIALPGKAGRLRSTRS